MDSAERGRGERSVHPNRKKAKTATKGWVVDESNQEAFCKTVFPDTDLFSHRERHPLVEWFAPRVGIAALPSSFRIRPRRFFWSIRPEETRPCGRPIRMGDSISIFVEDLHGFVSADGFTDDALYVSLCALNTSPPRNRCAFL